MKHNILFHTHFQSLCSCIDTYTVIHYIIIGIFFIISFYYYKNSTRFLIAESIECCWNYCCAHLKMLHVELIFSFHFIIEFRIHSPAKRFNRKTGYIFFSFSFFLMWHTHNGSSNSHGQNRIYIEMVIKFIFAGINFTSSVQYT